MKPLCVCVCACVRACVRVCICVLVCVSLKTIKLHMNCGIIAVAIGSYGHNIEHNGLLFGALLKGITAK